MAPKRLISGENNESSESASVSEPQPSTSGFTGITPDFFMDASSSSSSKSSSSSSSTSPSSSWECMEVGGGGERDLVH
ncbi:hypothetical protein E2C01_036482 [Portunus trituberculatus]|uniref:Uncharacterized protein n=1 Tax=Portunus trituberculatus TaxID=210409 RepID=A0A5B7F6U1_PORTR|nr:hypothetical protein [Portunus trituberculatus]